jgi:hypothetical protein
MSSQEKIVGQSRRKEIPERQKSTAPNLLPKKVLAKYRKAVMLSSIDEMDRYKNG